MTNKRKLAVIVTAIITVGIIIITIICIKQKKADITSNELQIEPNYELSQTEQLENNTLDQPKETPIITETEQEIEEQINESETVNENEILEIETIDETEEISDNDSETEIEETNEVSSYDEEYFTDGHLKHYPKYGDKYARLKISKLGINTSIYFGTKPEILAKGVAHDTGSYLPGEGGSIIMCGHNYMNNFSKLGRLNNGDIINVTTDYGEFSYRVYNSKVVYDTETDELPIQEDEEILMIYTCYPFYNTGYTEQRYVVYAEKI